MAVVPGFELVLSRINNPNGPRCPFLSGPNGSNQQSAHTDLDFILVGVFLFFASENEEILEGSVKL